MGIEAIGGARVVAAEVQGSRSDGVSQGAAASAALPDPIESMSTSTDLVAQMAAMLVKSLRQERNAARTASDLAEARIRHEGERRVAAMRDKADAIRKEGLMRGVSEIGSGVLGASGNLVATKESWTRGGDAIVKSAGVTDGIGELLARGPKAQQTDLDADIERSRTSSELAGKRQDRLEDDVRDAKELLGKVSSFLRECNGARNSAMQASAIRA